MMMQLCNELTISEKEEMLLQEEEGRLWMWLR